MYFDFEDYRPETPRVTRAISVREGILLSIIVHLVFLVALLLFPDMLSPSQDAETLAQLEPDRERPPLTFVEAVPLRDLPKPPERPAPMSDLDRRASAPDPPPVLREPQPAMRGNTPEMVEGGPSTPQPPPSEPAAQPGCAQSVLADSALGRPAPTEQADQAGAQSRARLPLDMFRDVGRYTRPDRFNNIDPGGATDQSADIQFDSMGVDFGSWLRRFKNQVERNWLIPPAAMVTRGRVVIRFVVLRNGTLIDLQVLQSAPEPSLTSAALNALKLSNPTAQLPAEYPADRMPITVTFYYNEDPRRSR